MEGYELYTSDDDHLGHVVERRGDCVVVEHGRLRKTRHAIPLTFVEADDGARVVRSTLSKHMIEDSPRIEEGELEEDEIARYYGLAAGDPAPDTQGYGVVNPDDPARTADDDAASAGLATPEEQRAQTRTGTAPGEGPHDTSVSPGLLGGDRFRDADP